MPHEHLTAALKEGRLPSGWAGVALPQFPPHTHTHTHTHTHPQHTLITKKSYTSMENNSPPPHLTSTHHDLSNKTVYKE
eukprot:2230081-Amphidinium_carterae.1